MAKARIESPILTRAQLFRVAIDWLGMERLVEHTGEDASALQNFADTDQSAGDDATGATVALLRMRFVADLSPELLACARERRKRYLVDYMRDRAAADPAFAAKRDRLSRESKARHRSAVNARERARYRSMTREQRLARLDKKRELRRAQPASDIERELSAARRRAMMDGLADNPAALRDYKRRKRLAQRRWAAKAARLDMLGRIGALETILDD